MSGRSQTVAVFLLVSASLIALDVEQQRPANGIDAAVVLIVTLLVAMLLGSRLAFTLLLMLAIVAAAADVLLALQSDASIPLGVAAALLNLGRAFAVRIVWAETVGADASP